MSSSCFPDLSWPSCNSDASKGIYDCADVPADLSCCLSGQTENKDASNCPAGWVSDPRNEQEWCTDDWNAFSPNLYRHKCQRLGTLDDSASLWSGSNWPEACVQSQRLNLLSEQPSLALGSYPFMNAAAYSAFIGIARGLRKQELISKLQHVSTSGAGTLFWGTFSFAPQDTNPLGASFLDIKDLLQPLNTVTEWFNPFAEPGETHPGCLASNNYVCTKTGLEFLNEHNFFNFYNAEEVSIYNNQFLGNAVVVSPRGESYREYLKDSKSVPYALGKQFLSRYGLDNSIMALDQAHAAQLDAHNKNAYSIATPFPQGPFWIANTSRTTRTTPDNDFYVTPLYAGDKSTKVGTFALGAPSAKSVSSTDDACAPSRGTFNPPPYFEPFGLSSALATSFSSSDTSIWNSAGAAQAFTVGNNEADPRRNPFDYTGILSLLDRGVKTIVSVFSENADPEKEGKYVWQEVNGKVNGILPAIQESIVNRKPFARVKNNGVDLLVLLLEPSQVSDDFISSMPADVQEYLRDTNFPAIAVDDTLTLERPMVNLLAEYGQFLIGHSLIQEQVSQMFPAVCAQEPAGGCYPDLSWPSCGPDGASIRACTEVTRQDSFGHIISDDLSAACCLSPQSVIRSSMNCPPGWTADVNTEYCTSALFTSPVTESGRMLKCHRKCSS
jgi:hypothetical protein